MQAGSGLPGEGCLSIRLHVPARTGASPEEGLNAILAALAAMSCEAMCGLPDVGVASIAAVSVRGGCLRPNRKRRLLWVFLGSLAPVPLALASLLGSLLLGFANPPDGPVVGLGVSSPSLGSSTEASFRDPGAGRRAVPPVPDRMKPDIAVCAPALDLSGHGRR
jgi:hypothetical protein